jgi:hypothetical protein
MEGVELHLGYLQRLGAIAHGLAQRALEPALDEPVELFARLPDVEHASGVAK